MKKGPESSAEFDRYAAQYRELHRTSTAVGGEEPEYFAAYKAAEVARRIGAARNEDLRVLDFGTGIGGGIPYLRQQLPESQLFGADVSRESIRLAQERHGAEAAFTPIVGAQLDYGDATFDVAIAACVFHHIPVEERLTWMSELRRVLRPGGQLFVFEHNPLNPLTVKVVKDCPFDEGVILLHRKELEGLAYTSGFARVETRYIVFFPKFLSILRSAEPSLAWLPLGAQYYVHATA